MPLSNNTNIARKVGDALGRAYTMVTRANVDHARALHDTILAYVFDDLAPRPLAFYFDCD